MCKTVLASCNHEILGLHKAKVLAQYRTVQYACTHTTHHQISHRPELQQAWLSKSLAPSIKNLTIRLGSFGWFCRRVTMALLLDTVPILVLSPDPANKVMSASYNRISKTSRTPPPIPAPRSSALLALVLMELASNEIWEVQLYQAIPHQVNAFPGLQY